MVENLCEGIALNSKAHIGISPETRKVEYQGSKTECALLLMIQDKWDHDFLATRTRYHDRHAIRNLSVACSTLFRYPPVFLPPWRVAAIPVTSQCGVRAWSDVPCALLRACKLLPQ